jgi:hypothetical protein
LGLEYTYRPVYLRWDAKAIKGGGAVKNSRFVACCVGFVALTLVFGCQSAPKGPTDAEMIATAINGWQEALTAKNFDALSALYSESYVGERGEDKAGMRQFLEQAAGMGYLDGMTIDISGAETTIEEGKASVGPLMISGAMGAMKMQMDLAKEEDGWLIVGGKTL